MGHNLPWFKLYSEIIHDPKIRRLTVHERWLWIVILSLCASSDDRHTVCVTREIGYENYELADLCGYQINDVVNGDIDPIEMVSEALIKFQKLQMIEVDDNKIIYIKNFEKRQDTYLSEAERAKRYREKKNAVTNVTKHNVTTVTLDKNREEKNRIDNTPKAPKGDERFEKFWKTYPVKASKGQAEKTWKKLNPNEQLTEKILQAVERAKTSDKWRKDNGQFIPYPATWLNAKGWEDSLTVDLHTPKQQEKPAILEYHERLERGELTPEEMPITGDQIRELTKNLAIRKGL